MPFPDSKHLFQVWRANARASLMREMAYRSNFILGIIRQILWLATFLIFIDALFNRTASLAGWSQAEVLIILALSRIIEGTMNVLFTNNLLMFTRTVQTGDFDLYLLKPVPAQFFTAFRRVQFESLGNVVAGFVILIYALIKIPSGVSAASLPAAFVLALAGITVYYSLLVLVASLAFKLERLEALWGFNTLFSEPLTVPFDVFPSRLKLALTYILPLAFVIFIPAEALTGRLAWWQLPLAVGVAVIMLALANLAWRAGLRRYTSASS